VSIFGRIADRIRREPAVVIGIVAAAVLAVVQSLAGNEVISPDIAASIGRALDPQSGWALPIIVGIVTRFFVSPATSPGV
jgi:MFS family permease